MKSMLTAEDVFITTGFPEHTYVAFDAGSKENELREGLAQKNMIISISGPSKSGKTTLCDRVFGKEKGLTHIYVTGDAITKVDDLWFEAYRQVTDEIPPIQWTRHRSSWKVMTRSAISQLLIRISIFTFATSDLLRIPTGFHPSAQGWSEATTLGHRSEKPSTPTGLLRRFLRFASTPSGLMSICDEHPA
jgi:hypothetical protein